jgi:hypothetical protein
LDSRALQNSGVIDEFDRIATVQRQAELLVERLEFEVAVYRETVQQAAMFNVLVEQFLRLSHARLTQPADCTPLIQN